MMEDGKCRFEYAEIVMNRGFVSKDHNAVASFLSNSTRIKYSTVNPK